MQHFFKHALILAAGRGNRMRPLTDIMPKAMSPYKGDTLVGNSLKMLSQYVDSVHITVAYKSAMLAQYAAGLGISSILNTEGHTNSWWIHNTLMRYVDEPVIVLTCDNIIELDFDFLAKDYLKLQQPACMLVPVRPLANVEGDYIEHIGSGLVVGIDRHKPTDIYCSGIQILNPARVASLVGNEGDFYSAWRQLISREELYVSSVYPKKWFTFDTLEQLLSPPE